MNIYKFFSSRSIAEYCKDIQYAFTPLEMAVIVALSDNILDEKMNAWQEIIDEYPDCAVAGNHVVPACDSLHEMLRGVIRGEAEGIYQMFTPATGFVYQVHVCVKDGRNTIPTGCFTTPEKALGAYKTYWNWDEDGVEYIVLHRLLLDGDVCDKAYINRDDKPFLIYREGDYGNELVHLFVHIPMPFNKGDLVLVGGKPHVLESLPHWTTSGKLSYEKFVTGELGDGFDQQAGFYYIDENGHFTWEHGSYLDVEKFTGELTGKDRFLAYVSSFMQKDGSALSLPTMLNAFLVIKAEEDGKEYSEDLVRFPGFLEG